MRRVLIVIPREGGESSKHRLVQYEFLLELPAVTGSSAFADDDKHYTEACATPCLALRASPAAS
jgi:hypothetical protein